ncbi:hypothetical protein F5Y01DRAFT_329492 [Xylaria sp. FL0043]|nr:hypothetical protein F5Y01DRAFT_329492 [Xylaria sp. FL0043]
MNSNTYEMEGSPAWFNNPHALVSNNPAGNYHFEMLEPESQPPGCSSGSQLNLNVLSGWSQAPGPRPPYQEGMATGYDPDPSCLFRSQVLDDCAKARFYARALEFYLLENEHPNAKSSCPLAACTAQFKTAKGMLQHLKHCKKFVDGKFWCPTCCRFESFRVRTGKRCSWDKDHLGRRLLKKSKSVFQAFGTNHSASQQISSSALCPKCSTQLPNSAMPGVDDALFSQVRLMPPTKLYIPPNQSGMMVPYTNQPLQELYSHEVLAELSELSSCESSPSQCLPQSGSTLISSISEMSSVSTSPNGSSLNSGISPASSSSEESSSSTRRHRAASILSKAGNRVAGFCGDADADDRIFNQFCTSLDYTASSGYGILVPPSNLNFIAPSPSPPVFTQRSSRIMPRLTIETPQDNLVPAATAPALGIEILLQDTQPYGTSAVTGDLIATTLSPGTTETQLNEVPVSDPFITPGDSSFTVQPTDSSTPPSPPESQSSPTDVSPQVEMRCKICDFKIKRPKKAYMKKHMTTHEIRTSIACPHSDCKKTFTRRDNLKHHLKVFHEGSRKRRRGSPESLLSAPRHKK